MECLFETVTDDTFEEYKRFCKAVFRRISKMRLKSGLIAAAMVLLACVGFVQGDIKFGAVFLLAAPVFLAVMEIRLNSSVKKSWNTNRVTQGLRTTYRFYPDFYEQENELGYSKVYYEKLYRILETDTNFYLMYGKNQGVILVKERCSRELMEFLREKAKR